MVVPRCRGMPNAMDRSSKVAKSLGGAATSSNETPVSSAENPDPKDGGGGNTAATRPRPRQGKRTRNGREADGAS
jgi:hypothetical protein